MLKDEKIECSGCGAFLKFEPGTDSLKCEYCGAVNKIEAKKEGIKEIDYKTFINKHLSEAETTEVLNVKCNTCSAEITFKPNITSDECPFCGSSIILTNKTTNTLLKPKYILPFKVNKTEAQTHFKKWLGTLWFAPNKLKHYAREDGGLSGVYMPFWTYDSKTFSSYSGQRGDDYYTTETYTDYENGKSVTKTRQVRHTRWRSVSGSVNNIFDDIFGYRQ